MKLRNIQKYIIYYIELKQMPRQERQTDLPRLASTMHGVQKWYKHMSQKLGWMVIARGKGYDDKVAMYKKSLSHLLETIDHIAEEYTDADRLHDLNVIRMDAEYLYDYVLKNL